MNNETLKASWHQLKAIIKKKWGRLTDADIAIIDGSYDHLLTILQEKYDYELETAEKELMELDEEMTEEQD